MALISFNKLQKLGQSLMVPVSVLPGAGLVVAIGRLLQINSTITENGAEVITSPIVHSLGMVIFTSGISIFQQLPLIFAIGVAIGFSGGAGVAGLSAAAAYFTLVNILEAMTTVLGLKAIPINTGVFGGIIAGLLAAACYKKYSETRLHPVFGFFSGKRLVPIMSMAFMIFVGLALSFVWPPIQGAIKSFGLAVTNSEFGPAFYAAGKRLLIPVGLHHVYYPSFLYDFGQYIDAAGKVFHGDSARYYAGDASAGLFMASEFPIMLFGLPMAALAMVLRAPGNKRKAIAGIMISAALTSIITGITEPIEFAFIFVAPLLFVIHVALAFVSGFLTHLMDVHLGYTFSASLIDFGVGYFNQKNSQALWLIIGPLIGCLYFVSFYFLIPLFNFKTPGREDEEVDGAVVNSYSAGVPLQKGEKAQKILAALGGKDNIINIDACITRLRLTIKDMTLIQEATLRSLGSSGMMKASGGSLQVIFGTESDLLKDEIKVIMLASAAVPSAATLIICSPILGKVVSLENIPDPTFSQGIIGPGLAIEPSEGVVYAPFDGQVVNLFRTNHALGLESSDGVELLIHIGLDTVKLDGRGFTSFVKQGDFVKKGQKLLEFDCDLIIKEGKSLVSPLIITNGAQFKKLTVTTKSELKLQETMIHIEK